MANVGVIEQYKGPYSPGTVENPNIILTGNACKIGMSISEDDFMSWQATQDEQTKQWSGKDFVFKIILSIPQLNSETPKIQIEQIHMGRTFMYQSQQAVNQPIRIFFPDGAPTSLIVDVVYSQEYTKEEE